MGAGRPLKGLIAVLPTLRVSIPVLRWLTLWLDREAASRSQALARRVSRGEALDLWVREIADLSEGD